MPSSILDRGLTWVLWLQQFSPGLDGVMSTITLFGEAAGIVLVLSLLYWGLDRRLAVRLVLLFVLSLAINTLAKNLFMAPRPYQYDARVLQLDHASGGGLPSGHTQAAVVVWGFFALWVRRRWAAMLAIALMVLVPLSRMYLGMHFPTDLLGGYVLGGLLLWAFTRLEPAGTQWLGDAALPWRIGLTVVLPALLLASLSSADRNALAGALALLGGGLGYHLLWPPARDEMGGTALQRVLRWLVGLGATALLAAGVMALPNILALIGFILLGVWVTVGTPWLFVRLGLARQRPLRRRRSAR